MRARAPGKVMLAGEYAVLEGGDALVMAVDRAAVARVDDAATPGVAVPPEVSATLALARREGMLVREHRGVRVDTTALSSGGRKLGLGSSAAGCVAALAAALAVEGHDPGAMRDALARTARRGHRKAQGGGSGVDVLASALGGVLHVTSAGDDEPRVERVRLPAGLHWAVLWTGTPVRTSDLIARVRAHADRAPDGHRALITAVRDATRALLDALAAAHALDAITAVRAHGLAMDALGKAAGAPIVTSAMRQLAAQIEPLGAACKPSGAGGGDIVWAVAHDADCLARVLGASRALGFEPIASLAIDELGARAVGEGG